MIWPFKRKKVSNTTPNEGELYQLLDEIGRNFYKYDGLAISEVVRLMPEEELQKYSLKTWFGVCFYLFNINSGLVRKLKNVGSLL